MRVKLKAGVGTTAVRTQGFDAEYEPGKIYDVTEDIFQRHLMASELFEAVAEVKPSVVDRGDRGPRRGGLIRGRTAQTEGDAQTKED